MHSPQVREWQVLPAIDRNESREGGEVTAATEKTSESVSAAFRWQVAALNKAGVGFPGAAPQRAHWCSDAPDWRCRHVIVCVKLWMCAWWRVRRVAQTTRRPPQSFKLKFNHWLYFLCVWLCSWFFQTFHDRYTKWTLIKCLKFVPNLDIKHKAEIIENQPVFFNKTLLKKKKHWHWKS